MEQNYEIQAQIANLEAQKRHVGLLTAIYMILILCTLVTIILPIILLIVGGIHTSANSKHNAKLDEAIRDLTPRPATGDKTIYF